MPQAILGTRIRERRRALGITQAELSRRVGISASYMNLIERNKRSIAGSLLRRTAEALGVDLDELDGAAERRLLETLDEIAHLPRFAALNVEAASAGNLIGRYPGWARALAALAASEHAAQAAARALADRMTHDPFLGETVHRMLTRIAAIRSTAEILTEYPELPAERRSRFHRILHEESRVLSDVADALAGYFDKAHETDSHLTPTDEVEALFEAQENRFEAIETAAEVLVSETSSRDHPLRPDEARTLVDDALGSLIDETLATRPEIRSAAAQSRARAALIAYAVGAVQAPMAKFAPCAAELAYDVEELSATFSIDVGTICLRMAALAGAEGRPRFGYFRANAAGTIIERRGLPGLVAPRYAAACPLWVLYRAQQSPEAILRQRTEFPSGDRFVFIARARHVGTSGFGRPRHYLTDMLVMSEVHAKETVYAPDPGVPVEDVGPACRICPREACPHRVEDPLA